MKILTGGFWGVAALIFFGACSAKHESNGTCADSPACGGDIVGVWRVASSCVSVNMASVMSSSCPEETETASGLKVSGTITYGADLTYTTSLSETGTIVLKQPTSCLTDQGITCAVLQSGVQSTLKEAGFSSASCVESGGACSCTFVLSPATRTTTGTYSTTSAGVLTETPMGSSTSSNNDYCASSSRLTLSPHADSTMAGMPGSSGTITLTK